MKIVQAAGWYFPTSSGGTEVYVGELSKRLLRAGYDVLVAAPDPLAHAERTYEHDGVKVYRYPLTARPTRAEAQGRTPARGSELFHAWLARVRPDIVHMHTYVTGMGLFELRAAARTGARVFTTTHSASLGFACQRGTLMRWGTRVCSGKTRQTVCAACQVQNGGVPRPLAYVAGMIPSPLGALGRHVAGSAGTFLGMSNLIAHNQRRQREAFAQVERFFVLSDYARGVLLANGAPPEKVAVNRLGVRFHPLQHQPRQSKVLTVAYIGRFDPVKGVEDLARAIASLPPDIPVHFEFHGPVRNKADLAVITRVKATVQGGPWVTFGPELNTDDVRATLARVDVLCCPSRVIEGGPTVALEANACGTPVIGTDIPALSEIVEHNVNGRLVPIGSAKQLANAFRDLAKDPSVVDRWRAALRPVRTMDDVTREYMAEYGVSGVA